MATVQSIDTNLRVRSGYSTKDGVANAVSDLQSQIAQPNASVTVVFVSPKYDLEALGPALREAFDGPVVGCSSSGEITPDGYCEKSLTGFSLSSEQMEVHLFPIRGVRSLDHARLAEIGEAANGIVAAAQTGDPATKAFCLCFIDGLSVMEEQVVAHLSHYMRSIPIIGGSAGDDLAFHETRVCVDGSFETDTAMLALFVTTHSFATFKTQHYVPSDQRMVITRADPPSRIVHEINGAPAAEEYARMLGLEIGELDPMIFSKYPTMLKIGGEHYIRSIQKVNPDGSLTFFCAIDEGLVLTLSRGMDIISSLRDALSHETNRVNQSKLVVGCECVLRRLETIESGLTDEMNEVIREFNVVGFHTYGEQINSVHVNQTFTGIVLGE